MNVNPKIKLVLAEIAESSVKYANSRDDGRRYNRKLLRLFKERLSEDEQLYIIRVMLDQLSYRTIVTDPDNVITIGNVKLRTQFMIFILSSCFLVLASYLFGSNGDVKFIGDIVVRMLKVLGISL